MATLDARLHSVKFGCICVLGARKCTQFSPSAGEYLLPILIENNSHQVSIYVQLRAACGQQLPAPPNQVFPGVVAVLRAVGALLKKNTVFTDIHPTTVFHDHSHGENCPHCPQTASKPRESMSRGAGRGCPQIARTARTTITAGSSRCKPGLTRQWQIALTHCAQVLTFQGEEINHWLPTWQIIRDDSNDRPQPSRYRRDCFQACGAVSLRNPGSDCCYGNNPT